jgi:hypothetical protein
VWIILELLKKPCKTLIFVHWEKISCLFADVYPAEHKSTDKLMVNFGFAVIQHFRYFEPLGAMIDNQFNGKRSSWAGSLRPQFFWLRPHVVGSCLFRAISGMNMLSAGSVFIGC